MLITFWREQGQVNLAKAASMNLKRKRYKQLNVTFSFPDLFTSIHVDMYLL